MASIKIVVCEDESIVAKDLQNRLKKMGYTVSAVVSTGDEAIKKTAEYYPDLVLMDIKIKGNMDGVEAASEIQKFFDVPVIYLTAYADDNTLERAKVTNPCGYILKPFKERELHANIEITLSRHRMEKKLKEREQWLATVLKSIADAAIATDIKGQVTFMNPVAEALTGWKQEELVGIDARELFTIANEETHTFIESPLTKVLQKGIVLGLPDPTILVARNGREIPINESIAPLKDEKGNITGAIWVFRDITVSKQAQKALRESEARFRRLVESNIIGIKIADFTGNLIEANDAFLQIGGYAREDFLAGKVRWSDMTPPEYGSVDEQALKQVKVSGVCTPYEKEYIRSDGKRVSVLVGMALLEGTEDRFVAFVLDITDRKRLEKVLRHQAEELAQANRMKDEFLAVVSHEIRTPLTAMLGWAGLLSSKKLNEATTARALQSIERNAKAQVKIIDDIMDVSRIIRGHIRLVTHQVNLISLINSLIDDLRPTAEAKNIQVDSVLLESIGTVSGDSDRLRQIVWNLLSNAIKFTPVGGRVQVRLSVAKGQGETGQVGDRGEFMGNGEASAPLIHPMPYAQIQIADTGKGIDPDFLPYVFDRFRQADSTTTRAFGGLGLGLAIARHLVELHGGSIYAASDGEGKGATFTVQLPLVEKGEATREKNEKKDRTSPFILHPSPFTFLCGLRVLLVEDDADACEAILFVLEEYGAKVTAVASAAEALAAIAQLKPDVLISDIGMPDEDGYSLIRQVRSFESGGSEHIPAIALTAFARDEDATLALKAGFQMHVRKPIEPANLVDAIANLLALKYGTS